jgi:hypothetical protein
MAVTIQPLGAINGHSNNVTREYSVANGSVVYDREFVYLDANGRVTSDSVAGKRLLGTVVGGDSKNLDRAWSGSATGNSAGTVKVLVNINKEERYLVKNDNDTTTFAAAHVGDYADLIGAPGSQLVDSSSHAQTGAQLLCVEYNPGIRDTDATYGIYIIAENQQEAP